MEMHDDLDLPEVVNRSSGTCTATQKKGSQELPVDLSKGTCM
jgi:hypothetical protein